MSQAEVIVMRSPLAPATVVALTFILALARDGDAAPFAAKPPMIGGILVLPQACAFDGAGNRYVAGAYFADADFDPGTAVVTRPVLGAGSDLFVASYTSAGALRWVTNLGGSQTDLMNGTAA